MKVARNSKVLPMSSIFRTRVFRRKAVLSALHWVNEIAEKVGYDLLVALVSSWVRCGCADDPNSSFDTIPERGDSRFAMVHARPPPGRLHVAVMSREQGHEEVEEDSPDIGASPSHLRGAGP